MHTGFPSPAQSYHEKSMNLQDLLVPHPETTFFMRAGSSYEEYCIQKGDIMVVDRGAQPSAKDLVIAVVNARRCLMRFEKLSRCSAGEEDAIEVWGTVTSIVRPMRVL